ncbi:MAG: murein biosynthesis integral membrane protein MurJ [Pigmentiphaga sp.]|nr:murein biosynthesis integral membrane protein MurJ [Pigmentiphaga sp.]
MSLLRAAATISSLTLLSRISGLVRDILIARAFGAGSLTDAFWVAFRIPNLLRRLFAEGAFSQAFVPILGEAKSQESPARVQQLMDRVAVLLTLAVMGVTVLGVLGAPVVVSVMASGLRHADRAGDFAASVTMTRVMFPYIVCMALVALASGILNTWRHFAVPAFTPILLNLSMIGASLWLVNAFSLPIYALAVGVMIGGIAQLAVQLIALRRLGVCPRWSSPREAWHDSTVRRILKQMLPATLGVSVAQLSLLINTNIATWLTPGSVTWLSFADRLMEFPTALLGIALGTVLLPSLSRAHGEGRSNDYNALLNWGMRLVLLLGLPATVGLALLSEGLVSTLFHYGQFAAADVAQTRLAVIAYAVGLLGLLLVKILAPGFYAKQDIRTPVRIAIFVLIATQCLNLVFVPWLAHAGLALSIGLAACINAGALLAGLLRRGIFSPETGWLAWGGRIGVAAVPMALFLLWFNGQTDWLGLQASPAWRLAMLLLAVGGAAVIYVAMLLMMGVRPRDLKRKVSSS